MHVANLSASKIGQMTTAPTRTRILDEVSVQRKIKRMALEIAEQNSGEKELLIAGIAGNGEAIAKCIAEELKKVSPFETTLFTIDLDKRDPHDVSLRPAVDVRDKIVLLADDVANTGRTMFFALKPFLNSSPKKVQTLALVERSHKEFPIHTDYTGLSIATTLQEHIAVEVEGEKIKGAWLY